AAVEDGLQVAQRLAGADDAADAVAGAEPQEAEARQAQQRLALAVAHGALLAPGVGLLDVTLDEVDGAAEGAVAAAADDGAVAALHDDTAEGLGLLHGARVIDVFGAGQAL